MIRFHFSMTTLLLLGMKEWPYGLQKYLPVLSLLVSVSRLIKNKI